MDAVRFGIIGLGNMGSNHCRTLLGDKVDRAKLTAICDTDPARMAPFAGVEKFDSSDELLDSGAVDAVLIATPHYDHTTIGVAALERGLHVLVEKPISVHKADAQRLIDAYNKASGQVFGAMFQLRTEPAYQRIRKLVTDGELGELQRVNWIVTAWFRSEAYYASGGWRATWKGEGGGILLNQCPHNLDLLQWMGGMPTRVRAFCGFGKFHDIEVEDEVTAYFEYPNGATGVFVASTGEAPGTERLELAGDRGNLVFEGGKLTFRRNTVPTPEYSRTTSDSFGRPEAWNVDIPIPHGPRGHVVVAQNFVNAILDGEPLIAPADEGIRSVELANAMIYSALEGKAVDLPLDAQTYEQRLQRLISESKHVKHARETGPATDFDKSYHG